MEISLHLGLLEYSGAPGQPETLERSPYFKMTADS
jgi:hypothetical protein